MKNKKGFIAISVIFSFFIVFLMLMMLILTSYAQNRILMNQVKKDIKSNNNLVLSENKEIVDADSETVEPDEDVSTSVCKLAEVSEDGTKICAPKNYNTCAKIGAPGQTGNSYYKIQITPNNVAILRKYKTNISEAIVFGAAPNFDGRYFYVPTADFVGKFKGLTKEYGDAVSYGGNYWEINFSACSEEDLDWYLIY